MKLMIVDELETLIKRMKELGKLTGKEEVWFAGSWGSYPPEHPDSYPILDAEIGYCFKDEETYPHVVEESGLENFTGEDIEEADKVFCLTDADVSDEYKTINKILGKGVT